MMYVLDKVGLDLVMKSGAIFDCLDPPKADFINLYERKMGRAILDAGYAIRPLIGGRDIVVSKSNLNECIPCGEGGGLNSTELISCHLRDQYRDIWIKSRYAPVSCLVLTLILSLTISFLTHIPLTFLLFCV